MIHSTHIFPAPGLTLGHSISDRRNSMYKGSERGMSSECQRNRQVLKWTKGTRERRLKSRAMKTGIKGQS